MTAPPEGSTLTTRQLNRALLARQHLLKRADMPATAMIEHLVGMQSQLPKDPFLGLWTRLNGFEHDELDRLMIDREAVRIVVMRGTIHLLSARDAQTIRPMMQAMMERVLIANATFAPHLVDLDLDEIVETGRALVDAQPSTGKQIGAHLGETWPDRDQSALSYAVRYLLPLVQITPRGVWGKSQQATLTTLQAWLGEPTPAMRPPDEIVLRYLRAFGPATNADIQAWSGWTGVREVTDRLRPQLVTYRNERKQELFDVPDGPFPEVDSQAPVRFLPGFENALLSHKDRTRIVGDDRRQSLWVKNGLVPGTFLLDGFVAGTWKATRSKTGALLTITPFEPLVARDRHALEDEGARLLAFLEPDAEIRDIAFS